MCVPDLNSAIMSLQVAVTGIAKIAAVAAVSAFKFMLI